jgi:hypothetical protein
VTAQREYDLNGYAGQYVKHPLTADPGDLVSAAYTGAEFAGAFAEQPLEPRLREMHYPHREIRQV